jgi:GT2 family glycosyltransferase
LSGGISVVIATYQRPDLIGGCLGALDRQSTPPLEVIVVDQSPDSRTRDIVQGRPAGPAPVRYLHSDRAGLSLARNIGVRASSGAIVAFTDDDALPEPGWIEAIANAFASTSPRAGLVGGRTLPLWERPRPGWFPASYEYLLPVFDPGGDLGPFPAGCLPPGVNLAVDREVVDRIGGFHEDVGQRPGWNATGDDSYFAWRAIEAGIPIYYQPSAVVHHRVPASRLTRRFLLERCYLEGIALLDVEEKRGILTSERLERHMRWHHVYLMRKVASLVKRPSFAPWNDPRVIETLSKIALSISIIRRGHVLMPQLPAPRP